MTCEQRRELYLLDAIGALPLSEQLELRDHLLGGCPACAGAQAEAMTIASTLPLDLDVFDKPEPATLTQLLQRIRSGSGAEVAVDRSSLPTHPTGRPNRFLFAAFAAPIAATVAALITAGVMWKWLGQAHHLLSTPDLQFVSLTGVAPQPAAHGRVFWDTAHSTWLVYFFDLKPPAAGKQYELWFITARSEKLAAGTFTVDAYGNAEMTTRLPAGTQLAAVAVTDERLGGVSSPQGNIQLLGKIQ